MMRFNRIVLISLLIGFGVLSIVVMAQSDKGEMPECVSLVGAETLLVDADVLAEYAFGDVLEYVALVDADEEDALGVIQLPLPVGNEADALQAVLFGDAQLMNNVSAADAEPPTVGIRNVAGYTVNLREGPGTEFPVVGVMPGDAEWLADARNAESTWFRVQTDEGTAAWVFSDLVGLDGTPNDLFVVGGSYDEPFASVILNNAFDRECSVAGSGLLIHRESHEDSTVQFGLNGVDVSLQAATVIALVNDENSLELNVLNGFIDVRSEGVSTEATAGESVRVSLDEDGLASTTPRRDATYRFAAVAGAPLDVLDLADESAVCVIGIGFGDEAAPLQGGPGEGYGVVQNLDVERHGMVTGQHSVDGEDWWKLGDGVEQAWVAQDNVRTFGLCGNNIAQSDPPLSGGTGAVVTDNTTVTGNDLLDNNAVSTGTSYVPATQTVWQAESGPDVLTGECTGAALAICSHLTAIIPNADGSISWRGQEPVPYTLYPTGENTYAFSGRNFQNNGTANLFLTFTSETSYSLTFTTVFDNDPACNHTFYYTATPRW